MTVMWCCDHKIFSIDWGMSYVPLVCTITENIFEGWKSALSGVLETSTVNLHLLHCTVDTVRWSCWWAALDVTHSSLLHLKQNFDGEHGGGGGEGCRKTPRRAQTGYVITLLKVVMLEQVNHRFYQAPTAEPEGHCFSYVIATVVHACKYIHVHVAVIMLWYIIRVIYVTLRCIITLYIMCFAEIEFFVQTWF